MTSTGCVGAAIGVPSELSTGQAQGKSADPRRGEIGAGEDVEDAGVAAGLLDIDPAKVGAGVRRPQDVEMGDAGKAGGDIVDVAGRAGDEPPVLLAKQRLADPAHAQASAARTLPSSASRS